MRVYTDAGNDFVVAQVPRDALRILDVGCGSGDTAALIKRRDPKVRIEGVTFNPDEARIAGRVLDRVHMFDIERDLPSDLDRGFDVLLFSHIVEHLRDPAPVIERFLPHLADGGSVVIAVPNVLEWRTRFGFLRGRFQYADAGIMDRTHLRFFTYDTFEAELLGGALRSQLALQAKRGAGAVPLGPLRRVPGFGALAAAADRLGVRSYPNLFAQQIVLVARKIGDADGARGIGSTEAAECVSR